MLRIDILVSRIRRCALVTGLSCLALFGLYNCSEAPQHAQDRKTYQVKPTATAPKPDNVVSVKLGDFSVELPKTMSPGKKVFEITNQGILDHSFEIEGKGLNRKLQSNVPPGGQRTMEVDLQPGDYEIYCPLPTHKERGMSMKLTVR